MSMASKIHLLETEQELFRYTPRGLMKSRRRFFMSKEMFAAFENSNSAVNILVGKGQIAAAFTLWTTGEHVYDNGRGKGGFLKRLQAPPPEIWEIRITNPSPQARVFGRFPEPDTFIATGMHTRGYLGKKGSLRWAEACKTCVTTWDSLFPQESPFIATRMHEYVTENCDDFLI